MKTKLNIRPAVSSPEMDLENTQDLASVLRLVKKIVKETCKEAIREADEEKHAEENQIMAQYYTKQQAKAMLCCSDVTLWRISKVASNGLVVVKIGGKVLYTRESVENLIARREDIMLKQ